MLKRILLMTALVAWLTAGQLGAQSSKTLRIASKASGESSFPYLIAQRLGFLHDAGLNLEVVVIRGTVGIQALIGGSVDYVNHNVIPAILRGSNIKILVIEADKPAH